MKKRIWEIANDYGLETKKLLEILKRHNIDAKSHYTSLTEEQLEQIKPDLPQDVPTLTKIADEMELISDFIGTGDIPIIDRKTQKPIDPRDNEYELVFFWSRNDPVRIAHHRHPNRRRAEFVVAEDPYFPLNNDLDENGHYKAGDVVLMKMSKGRYEVLKRRRREIWEQQRLQSLNEYRGKVDELTKMLGLEERVPIFINKIEDQIKE